MASATREPLPATHRRRESWTIVALFLVLALLPLTAVVAQRRVGGDGRRLDANFQVGSGGYNRPISPGPADWNRTRYSAGSSRSLYTVDQRGEMRYNRHNAFNPRSRYAATGYASRSYMSRSSYSRFRYGR